MSARTQEQEAEPKYITQKNKKKKESNAIANCTFIVKVQIRKMCSISTPLRREIIVSYMHDLAS